MVSTVTHFLPKVHEQSSVTVENLSSTLISIQGAVKSKHITYNRDLDALTTAHFLT